MTLLDNTINFLNIELLFSFIQAFVDMRAHTAYLMPLLATLATRVTAATAVPHHASQSEQHVIVDKPPLSDKAQYGVGHFSEWSRENKRQFLIDWQAGKESVSERARYMFLRTP